jgi:hypothetical protein
MNFSKLVAFEEKNQLWQDRLFGYPVWIHCREPLLNSVIMANRKMRRPSMRGMIKSFYQTIKFLLTQHKYEKVFFLMERAELLEVYNQESNPKKILFLNPEQETIYAGRDYVSSDFFSLLRLVSRKIAYLIFYKNYKEMVKKVEALALEPYIKNGLGDALFLKFLSLVISNKNEKVYSGAVIPIGEKFVNALNSTEVQHGVIHPEHVGYISIPEVANRLMLYSERYREILYNSGYKGELIVCNYKKIFFERKTNRHFPIVIYTQPLEEMQNEINSFLEEYKPKDFYIQKHPKDYFKYKVDRSFIVSGTIPSEVGYPIAFISSVVENFNLFNRDCYILNIEGKYKVEELLEIYTIGSESKMIIMDSLEDIYRDIAGRM